MVIYLLISFILVTGLFLIFILIVPKIMTGKLAFSQSEPALCISDTLKILAVNDIFIKTLNPDGPDSDIFKSDKFIGLAKVINESIKSDHSNTAYWNFFNGNESLNFFVNIQSVTFGIRNRCFLVKLILQQSKFDDIYFEVIHKLIHDLKSPLSTALISLQNLKLSRDENDDVAKSSRSEIDEYVQPALEAIDDIKKFANILSMLSNTTKNNYSACDFDDFLTRIITQIKDELTEGATLTREIQAKLPPAMINKREMELALKNIVVNRLKAMGGKGKIHITVSTKGAAGQQKIQVFIKDTIKEDLKSIITPKISDNHVVSYKDLLIAMRIIEKHGSFLLIETDEDQGNVLSFEINTDTENGKF
ncbi:MAG: sensor histidine kinase [Calditrichaceae bacterium]